MDNFSNPTANKIILIKNIYFYLVSFVTLMILVINTAMLINLALKTYIFTKADNYRYYPEINCEQMMYKEGVETPNLNPEECAIKNELNEKNQKENIIADRQREAVQNISFIAVALPLFILHWRATRKKENI